MPRRSRRRAVVPVVSVGVVLYCASLLLLQGVVAFVGESCPDSCPGTAHERHSAALSKATTVDLNTRWEDVRTELLQACGLQNSRETTHCFNDFNHVDCCTMIGDEMYNTNEESKINGMHSINALGAHIVRGTDASAGPGGSWCTCHIGSPLDVCHRQFGARPAFKLVWCPTEMGLPLAALVDDFGNLLNFGVPTGNAVPEYGGQRARQQLQTVLQRSSNSTYQGWWEQACEDASRNWLALHPTEEL